MEAVFRSQLEPREKLVALALADFADDDGGNVYPSIKTLADKVSMSAGNVRRIVRQLEKIGYARLVGNAAGGAPSATRRYRLNAEALDTPGKAATPTPGSPATPTPGKDARDPLQGCTQPLAPVQAEPSLTVREPSQGREARAGANPQGSPAGSPLPPGFPGDRELEEARRMRGDLDVLAVAANFRDHYTAVTGAKSLSRDWPATWRKWVRSEKPKAAPTPRRESVAHQYASNTGSLKGYSRVFPPQFRGWQGDDNATQGLATWLGLGNANGGESWNAYRSRIGSEIKRRYDAGIFYEGATGGDVIDGEAIERRPRGRVQLC